MTFKSLTDGPSYRSLGGWGNGLPDRIWALVDSNRFLVEPAQVFDKGRFFIVEAVSPRPSHRSWANTVPKQFFYMKPWAFSEVLQA